MRRRSLLVLLLLLFVPAAGAWTWPVEGPVLQTFSFDRAHPYAAGQHRGIAIRGGEGEPVRAPASGVVTFAGTVPTNGKTLTIETPSGLAVSLTHLGSITVARNASVDEGAAVGTVGASGTPEFDVPYVHLGVREAANDQGYLDPLAFLPVLAPPPGAPVPAPAVAVPAAAPILAAPQPVVVPAVPVAPPAPVAEAPSAPVVPVAPAVSAPAAQPVPEVPVVDLPVTALTPVMKSAPAAEAPAAAPTADTPPDLVVIAAPSLKPSVADLPLLGAGAASMQAPRFRRAYAGSPVRAPRSAGSVALWLPALATSPGTLAPSHTAVKRAFGSSPRGEAISASTHRLRLFAIALLTIAAGLAILVAVRMISSPSARSEGARPGREDSRRTSLAVRQWAATYRPRGRVRCARGRLRAVSPLEGQRRAHGERDGRARHAGDGVRRQDWGVAA